MFLSDDELSGFPVQIAARLIHPSRSIRPRGRKLASSIGGSKSVSSGSPGYEARTAGNGGSGLLIFVQRAAHDQTGIWRTTHQA
jgi:hypothetical protein